MLFRSKVGIQNPADFLRNAGVDAVKASADAVFEGEENISIDVPAPEEEDDAFDVILRMFKDKT